MNSTQVPLLSSQNDHSPLLLLLLWFSSFLVAGANDKFPDLTQSVYPWSTSREPSKKSEMQQRGQGHATSKKNLLSVHHLLSPNTHTDSQRKRLLRVSDCTVHLSCCYSFTHYNLQSLADIKLHQPNLNAQLVYYAHKNKDFYQN